MLDSCSTSPRVEYEALETPGVQMSSALGTFNDMRVALRDASAMVFEVDSLRDWKE